MTRDETERLDDIAEAIQRVRNILPAGTKGVPEATVRDAILYNLVIIGEAVKHLGDETRSAAPEIPWRRIAGLRDLLTHEYFRIEMNAIEKIVERDLGPLERAIDDLRRGGDLVEQTVNDRGQVVLTPVHVTAGIRPEVAEIVDRVTERDRKLLDRLAAHDRGE